MSEYYTPQIEDLFIGYECEVYNQCTNKLIKKVEWNTVKVALHGETGNSIGITQCKNYLKNEKLRTKYLTKEQIEAEGWSPEKILWEGKDEQDIHVDGFSKSISEILWYDFLFEEGKITIIKKYYRNEVAQVCETIFSGNCPSINEFRKIQKLLKIV